MHIMQSVLDWSLGALGVYGYLIVFVATVAENLFVIGSFVPGDIITAAAAFTATTPQGSHLSIWWLFAIATAGSLVGMNISYFLGVRGGSELIAKLGPRFGITIEAIEAGEEYFERYGALTILLARFIAVLKNMSPALAGATKMRVTVFEFFALLASAGYAGVLMAVGWFLGENFEKGLKYFGAFSWIAFVVVVGGGFLALRSKRRHDAKLLAERAAEFEAEHGPLTIAGHAAEEPADGDA
jgi:membrane-associated protein